MDYLNNTINTLPRERGQHLKFENRCEIKALHKQADNGTEFAELSQLERYGITVYFAHPYSSYERAQNERHNRIFRKYVPKGKSIKNYSAEQIVCFAEDMNSLPRKSLGYAYAFRISSEIRSISQSLMCSASVK